MASRTSRLLVGLAILVFNTGWIFSLMVGAYLVLLELLGPATSFPLLLWGCRYLIVGFIWCVAVATTWTVIGLRKAGIW